MAKPEDAASADPYPLRHRFTFEGTEYSQVMFRKLKGRDLLVVEREVKARGGQMANMGEMEATFHLLARAIGMPFEAVEEMAAEDVTDLAQKVSGFL